MKDNPIKDPIVFSVIMKMVHRRKRLHGETGQEALQYIWENFCLKKYPPMDMLESAYIATMEIFEKEK